MQIVSKKHELFACRFFSSSRSISLALSLVVIYRARPKLLVFLGLFATQKLCAREPSVLALDL
jgi:hypothetical protein